MVLGAQKFPPRWNFTVCEKKASVGELAVDAGSGQDRHFAASQRILGQDRQIDLLLPPQDHRIAVLSARVHALWN